MPLLCYVVMVFFEINLHIFNVTEKVWEVDNWRKIAPQLGSKIFLTGAQNFLSWRTT